MFPPIFPRPINPSCIVSSPANSLENFQVLKLAPQSVCACKSNRLESRCCCRRHVLLPIVNEKHAPRRPSQNIQRPAIDLPARLAQAHIAGTQSNIEVLPQAELREAILIRYASLIVECAQHVPIRCCKFTKDSPPAIGQKRGLRTNRGDKILPPETAQLIVDRSIEIPVHRDRIALPRVVGRRVPRFKGGLIEIELRQDRGALAMVPAIGEQHAADIEENYVEGEHRRLSVHVVALDELAEIPLGEKVHGLQPAQKIPGAYAHVPN